MNTTIKELIERKSVRVFTEQSISNEDREAILTAAVNAPSAGNMQMYSIIDVSEQSIKDRLAVLCDNQPFIASGKLVLVFVADYLKWHDAFRYAGCNPRPLDKGDLLLAVEDTMVAAQNAVTAAWSLGIGSCFIGDIMENHDEVKELLSLPDTVYPVCLLIFGHPTEQQKGRVKPSRPDLRHIVHENGYVRKDEKAIRELFADKAPEGMYDQWIAAFCARKYNSDFSLEMSASARKYLAEFKGEE